MKKVCIILNHRAGTQAHWKLRRAAREQLGDLNCEYVVPKTLAELHDYLSTLSAANCTAVVAVGGDGTVCQVLQNLKDKRIPVFPFPAGTANDLANHMGVRARWNELRRVLTQHLWRPIDLIDINGRPFATVGGCGLPAKIACDINNFRKNSWLFRKLRSLVGPRIYLLSVLWNAFRVGRYLDRVKICADNGPAVDMSVTAILVANQGSIAKYVTLSTTARNDDGLMDVTLVTAKTSLQFLASAISMLRRKADSNKHLIRLTCKSLTVSTLSGKPLPFFGDGESFGKSLTAVFTVLPGAATLADPQQNVTSETFVQAKIIPLPQGNV